MIADIRVAPLQRCHRSDIEIILRATGVFSEEEIGVALELFDETAFAARLSAAHDQPRAESREPNTDYEFIGAFSGDTLTGYACFGATPATDRTFDLYWIAVHPDAQRLGTGAALMADVERRLVERRARMLVIETSSRDDYAPTRRFYGKRGYAEAARLRDFYRPGDDRVVLTKRLTDIPVSSPGGAGGSLLPATRI